MKICYLCADPGIPVFGRKGCSTHVRETCLTLGRLGHDVLLICANAEGDDEDREKISLISVPAYRSRKLGFDLRHILTDRRLEKAAARAFADFRPEAIYERYSLYAQSGTRLARRFDLPHLLEVNALMTREQSTRLKIAPLARFVERRIYCRARHVVVVSEPLRKEIGELRGGESSITRMPMAVNLRHFSPEKDGAEVRERIGLNGKFVIGYVGTLTEWHGISLLHDLAARLRETGATDWVILVVGGDDRRVEINRQKSAESGMEDVLRFIGGVPYGQVPEYIRAMDVALVPDTTYWSSPAKLFEYQGCGVPVVAPRYAAIESAMDHEGEGLIFEPRRVDQMAEHILRIRADPELARAMGRRARERAERFHSWDSHAEEVVAIFRGQRIEGEKGG